jgi:Conjugative transposon protein TcpC
VLKDAPTRNGHAPADSPVRRWRVARTVRPARATRRLGRAPGTAVAVALLLLAAVGVKATLAPRAASTPAPRAPAAGVRDITEQGFAQAFARAYLSWDARNPDQHQRQVTAFLSDALDADGGLQMPPRGQQQVLWSAAIQDQTDAHGDRVITVAVQTTRHLLYLAVPVHRTRRGFLVIPRYPALVGPPVSDPGAAPAEERDVTDGALRAVAQRAVTNYLAGQRTNLLADLDPAAVVSLPTTLLDVRSVRSITKAADDRVAVEVAAADDAGIQWTLRYELTVLHRDRWYVRAIEPDPVAAGGRP